MVSSVDLDPSVFPFQDVRYKGARGRNVGTKPKIKKDSKPVSTFAKPEVPVQSRALVSITGEVGDVKGEKDKPKRRATPSPSPVRGGAVGGKVKEGSFVDGDSSGGPPNLNATANSVAKLKAHIDSKGECSVVMLVCYYCLGREKYQLCRGSCCTLVNSVINALVEQGDLDPNAEVRLLNFIMSLCCFSRTNVNQ